MHNIRKHSQRRKILGLDKKGEYNRLHSHMLPKFHRSNLAKELSMEQVDALQDLVKATPLILTSWIIFKT
ncbi:hypothetical protein [Methanobrevibacter olleyae]|uniref:hypothetical protein n=1 Tax=Methanobrevibacter olleyae TaxID=294671 RepID=UPI0011A9B7C1|nr:hypothetical protein [Methanobrevibacter olleyae]